MNPVMKITMAITRNVTTEDDTATAREHSTVGLDSWTLPVCTNIIMQNNNYYCQVHVNHEDSVS
jgi:hypothetical protein